MKELEAYLQAKTFVAYDTETTGIEKGSQIIGFSVSADTEVGYYVVLSYWDTTKQQLEDLETKAYAAEFLQKFYNKNLLMHNGVFDCMMTRDNFNVDLMPYLHTDTMILAHLTNENRHCGLKELGVTLYGEDAAQEQKDMKESVAKNGGVMTKKQYELYKADSELIAKYGAKDAILTLKVFYSLIEDLFDQGLDKFFYDEESMPLLRGPTYTMNSVGLRVSPERLQRLKTQLEAECMEAKAFIYKEITPIVQEEYPGTGKTNVFNIGSSQQLSWLLFVEMGLYFHNLTKEGRKICKFLELKLPYTYAAKRDFIEACTKSHGMIYSQGEYNYKTKKLGKPKKIGNWWKYAACGKETLTGFAAKYTWVAKLLEYKKNLKLLNTYVMGIQDRMKYNVIRPNFLQHGTTSGRYSCKNPNFQNLPRDDKRIKACIIPRPGNVFVGADYSQLEPRVFASFSGDKRLIACFESGDDFYSVIGAQAFDKFNCSLKKEDTNSFAKKYPELRTLAKVVALSSTYGTTAPKMAPAINKTMDEAQEIIDNYFLKFPKVREMMLKYHAQAKKEGQVVNLFGRPRRIPAALTIQSLHGNKRHDELPYEFRNTLNLAVNHPIQSTGSSIVNRSAVKLQENLLKAGIDSAQLILQVHDSLIVECPESDAEDVKLLMQDAMENTCELPNVALVAEPKIGHDLSEV